jgi:hypothetical protein
MDVSLPKDDIMASMKKISKPRASRRDIEGLSA